MRRAESAAAAAEGKASVLQGSVGVWRSVLRDVGAGLGGLGGGLGEAVVKVTAALGASSTTTTSAAAAAASPAIAQLQSLEKMVASLTARVEGAAAHHA